MRTLAGTPRMFGRRGLVIAVALATFAGGQAAASATSSTGPAPTYEEIQETWEKFGLNDRRPGLEDRTETDGRSGPQVADTDGFPTEAVIVGGSIGAGLGLTLGTLALLAGRRGGQTAGT